MYNLVLRYRHTETELINLTDTSIEFRTQLSRQSEPFFLVYKRTDAFTSVRKELSTHFSNKDNQKFDKEIWTLISATTQTIRYDSQSCQLPLDWTKYAYANKITKKSISCKRMSELLLILESIGLLTMYKGFHYEFSNKKGVEKSMSSTVVFNNSWLKLFNVQLCISHGTARIFDLVVLKDCKGNIISHKGMRGVGVEKNLLKRWNTSLSEVNITIDGVKVSPVYTTVFNNSSLKSSGRLFAGSFSSERSYLRKTITINGEPCTESDLQNVHFRVLYNKLGIDYQDDAYKIECKSKWDVSELRAACKSAGVIMLNAESRKSAQGALIRELSNKIHYDKEGNVCTKKSKTFSHSVKVFKTIPNKKTTTDYIFDSLVELHKQIASHFFKAEWGYLQNIDSLIAKQVVKAFLVVGEVVLTYHDSFVCCLRLQGFLIEKMKEAWEIVLGSGDGFGYDIEF